MTSRCHGGTSHAGTTAMRALVAAAALVGLTACSGSGSIGTLLPTRMTAAAPANAAVAAPAAEPAAPTTPVRAAPAGRSAQGAAMPQPTPQAVTPEQINADCWMAAEANKKLRDIDQRLKFVDKCVDERSAGK